MIDYSREHIDKILDRYWAGDTNLEEEDLLKNYFSDLHTIDKSHEEIAPYFVGLNSQKKTGLPEGYTTDYWKSEAAAIKETLILLSFKRLAIAASLTLLFGLTAYFVSHQGSTVDHSTVASADQAAQEAEKAILFMAEYFKKGQEASVEIKHLQTLGNIIN